MSLRAPAVLLCAMALAVSFAGVAAEAQAASDNAGTPAQPSTDITRRAKTKVEPTYPDLARKMELSGIVKIAVVVAPNGTVKEARIVGGHPLLAGAAQDAARKWRFEPAPSESTGIIEFKFEGRH